MPRTPVKAAAARGRAAIGEEPAAAPLSPPPARSSAHVEGAEDDGQPWEAAHRRLTFYCSYKMLDAIQAERERSRRSKTQIITDALAQHLSQR